MTERKPLLNPTDRKDVVMRRPYEFISSSILKGRLNTEKALREREAARKNPENPGYERTRR